MANYLETLKHLQESPHNTALNGMYWRLQGQTLQANADGSWHGWMQCVPDESLVLSDNWVLLERF